MSIESHDERPVSGWAEDGVAPADRDDRLTGHCTCNRMNRINPAVWEREDMHRALAGRDIATVYRLLQRYGAPQRLIAARTAQSQSEASEIISGKRKVASYELLARIADGLGIPRGWMGLAHGGGDEDHGGEPEPQP